MKKKLVVSAVSLTEGGTLTVLRECLKAAVDNLGPQWDIVALVHDRRLIDLPGVQCLEFPKAKKSYLIRLYYELFAFKKLSQGLQADLWLSLHDLTPNVQARRQAVYCHNPSPFYRWNWRDARMEPKFVLHNLLYDWVYGHHIARNFYVIVQQKWLRSEFARRYGVQRVIVAHPVDSVERSARAPRRSDPVVFFFPSLARFFKNFEVLCEAAALLEQRGVLGFEIRLTIAGAENAYAASIYKRYANVASLRFIGRQDKQQMDLQYAQADCLLFPSKLETWGLPITEARQLSLPMLVADLPYAHETVGSYDRVRFFPPSDAAALADLMQAYVAGTLALDAVHEPVPDAPFAKDWRALLGLLTDGL